MSSFSPVLHIVLNIQSVRYFGLPARAIRVCTWGISFHFIVFGISCFLCRRTPGCVAIATFGTETAGIWGGWSRIWIMASIFLHNAYKPYVHCKNTHLPPVNWRILWWLWLYDYFVDGTKFIITGDYKNYNLHTLIHQDKLAGPTVTKGRAQTGWSMNFLFLLQFEKNILKILIQTLEAFKWFLVCI